MNLFYNNMNDSEKDILLDLLKYNSWFVLNRRKYMRKVTEIVNLKMVWLYLTEVTTAVQNSRLLKVTHE